VACVASASYEAKFLGVENVLMGFPRSAAHLPASHRRARPVRALRRFCRARARILETYTPAVETAALTIFTSTMPHRAPLPRLRSHAAAVGKSEIRAAPA